MVTMTRAEPERKKGFDPKWHPTANFTNPLSPNRNNNNNNYSTNNPEAAYGNNNSQKGQGKGQWVGYVKGNEWEDMESLRQAAYAPVPYQEYDHVPQDELPVYNANVPVDFSFAEYVAALRDAKNNEGVQNVSRKREAKQILQQAIINKTIEIPGMLYCHIDITF